MTEKEFYDDCLYIVRCVDNYGCSSFMQKYSKPSKLLKTVHITNARIFTKLGLQKYIPTISKKYPMYSFVPEQIKLEVI